MGVVYKATDTKLERPVALKFLAPSLVEDEEGRRRFQREAKAAAALDHPNICTIHEIDEAEGQVFLAMAYLDGSTVSQKVKQRPLKLDEALDIAIQAGQGLQVAHEKGIVHRDIKSANLMVNVHGQVKIMDFGLAQLAERSKLTKTAAILGTPAYMSPEQAERQPTDRRTDIWSLGVVIYEMVTGRTPFEGEREQAVLYAIANEDPEPATALRSGLPIELDRIVGKAMAKSPGERYQHVDEMLVDLKALRGGASATGKTATAVRRTAPAGGRRGLYGGLAATAAVVLLGAAYWFGSSGSEEEPAPATLKTVPVTSYPGIERRPAISPDGDQVAFSWNGPNQENYDIYVQLIGVGRPLRLTNDPAKESSPVWSPDGRYVAFLRRSEAKTEVIRVPALGGSERKLGEAGTHRSTAGLSWSPGGKFLAILDRTAEDQSVGGSIFSLSVETGEKRRLTSAPINALLDFSPAFSPDGRWLAFVRNAPGDDVYLLSLAGDGGPEGEPHQLTFGGVAGVGGGGLAWDADSRSIVFSSARGGARALWRVSVSGGEPERLALAADNPTSPSISRRENRLVYEQSQSDLNIWRVPGLGSEPESSAQGQRSATRFIASTRWDHAPHFSPDGSKIVFQSDRSGSREIWVSDADGLNAVQVTSFEDRWPGSPLWSPDGRWIVFDLTPREGGTTHVHVVSAEGGAPRQLTSGPHREVRASWSRDGRWIYFGSSSGGDWQVWKVPFEGGEPLQVTRGGGREAMESPDGAFLYYAKQFPTRGIWRVPVNGGKEERVFDQGGQSEWEITEGGIYFLNQDAKPAPTIEFFRFAAKRVERVATRAEDTRFQGHRRISVSADGRWVLYGRADNVQSDIMLVEDFH